MRIRVDEIPESGRRLHFHWDQSRFSLFLPPEDPFPVELARPLNVNLEIRKEVDHIRITGTIEGVLRTACHRCLTVFTRPLNETVDIYLVEEEESLSEEEIELEMEDLDYEFFDGEVIEIDRLVVEQVFLTLPLKVLCSEECKGLCPRCGANLNEDSCHCPRDSLDSPFSILKGMGAPPTKPEGR